jgi:hypothetical protein
MAENNKNRPLHKNNTTGEMNISWMKSKGKYKVEVSNPKTGKLTYFGLFKTLEEAIPVRDKARKEFGYHENHGRK